MVLVALGIAVLAGWYFKIPALTNIHPSLMSMKANTALLFSVLGAGILCATRPNSKRLRSALGLFGLCIATLTGIQYVFGVDLRIDEFLVRDEHGPHPGRMAPATTLNFWLLGLALLFIDVQTPIRISRVATTLVATISALALFGYIYGADSLYTIEPYSSIALHTTVGFLIACLALVFARPHEGVMAVLAADTAGGMLLRRFLPILALLVPLLGYLRLLGQRFGIYDTSFGIAILVMAHLASLSAVVTVLAWSLHRADLDRRHRFAHEASERKQAADQLRLALEAAPTGMLLIDERGHIVLVNAVVEKLFGYAREELISAPIEILVPHAARDRHREQRTVFLREPVARSMGAGRELRGLRKDGSDFAVEIGLNPLNTPKGNFVLASIIDITERLRVARERDELLQQLRTLNADLEARVVTRTVALSNMVKEREVLLQEVHHRVKNNLQVISSLINMQIRRITEGSTRTSLEECQSRISTIALIHEKLYQAKDYASVPFSEYVKSLASNISHAMGVSPALVSLDISVETLSMPVDQAIPCGLMLNELITNALKHAFPNERRGKVRVDFCRMNERQFLLSVADDGVGLPPMFDVKKTNSLGMQLVATLAEQIDGTLEIIQHKGTTFRCVFTSEAP